jgi:uncharacterized SAM-binding protein YcdF (DUF218 family)
MRRLVVGVVALLAAAWLFSLAAVVRAARRDEAAPAAAIVVLGAAQYNGRPSPVLRARLDHAAQLFRRGLAPAVVVTGGVGARDTVSEAVVGRRYLVATGADSATVIAIGTGRSSEPSLEAAAAWIRQRGGRRVILVSDGFHMLRLCLIARRLGLVPLGSPARSSPIASNRRLEIGYVLAESFKAPIAYFVTR